MPVNWKKYNLGQIIKVKHGYAFKGKSFTTEANDNLLLTPGNFEKDGGIKFNWGKQKFYTGKFPAEYILQQNSLVIAMTDLTQACDILGAPLLIKDSKFNYLHNQRLGLVQEDEKLLSKYFLFYYFNSRKYRDRLIATKTGSTVSHTAPERIYDCEIDLPPLQEQKSIASILSALDDKIELNLQMNKTLEEMAMALYKHWFVDFGPFQDGEFVATELGEIPEGWEVKRLDEFALKKSESFNFKNKEDVVFVNTGDVQEGRFLHSNRVPKKGLPGQAKKAIAKGDILYSEIRPKNKRFAYVNFDSEDYVVSTKFMIINPKDNILSKLLYRILTMQSTVDNLNSIAEGRSGTFPQITFDAISDLNFVLPPLNVQQKFQEIVSPMEVQQDELYLENKTLTQLRDTLLPKLISGEVRVKDVEKTLSEVL